MSYRSNKKETNDICNDYKNDDIIQYPISSMDLKNISKQNSSSYESSLDSYAKQKNSIEKLNVNIELLIRNKEPFINTINNFIQNIENRFLLNFYKINWLRSFLC